jgi:hypothetical protein
LDQFVIGEPGRHILGATDAECIPLAIDVPAQTVSFTFLGRMCFLMGLKSVKINAEQKNFSAFGELGSITTEDIPGYGRVVRFQQNSRRSLCVGASLPGWWQMVNIDQIVGEFSLPLWQTHPYRYGDFDVSMTGRRYRPIEEARVADAFIFQVRQLAAFDFEYTDMSHISSRKIRGLWKSRGLRKIRTYGRKGCHGRQ